MNEQQLAGIIGVMLFAFCIGLVIGLTILILFLMTLYRALNRCSRRNRTMEPGMVFLQIIPLFSLIWTFIMTAKIGDSLKKEFVDRDIDDGSDYGKSVGMWWATTAVIGFVISSIGSVYTAMQAAQQGGGGGPFGPMGRNPGELDVGTLVSLPFSLASFVLWIVYWVKISGYSRTLLEDDERPSRDDDRYRDDEDDDPRDLPPRRTSRPDEGIQDRS